jgi:hypothetical protein
METPGKGLLKVGGILLIIYASILLILALLGMLGAAMMSNPEIMQEVEAQGVAVESQGAVWISALVTLALGTLNLIAGILAVKNCQRPEKAQGCFIICVILVVIVITNAILSTIGGTFSVIGVSIGLLLPVLCIWGALRNKEALKGSTQG